MGHKTVVLGMQWGDEGKGKLVDFLADSHSHVVRFNGGANAGHTVVSDGRTVKVHQVPAGILYDRVLVIGNGCVVHPVKLHHEIRDLEYNLGSHLDLKISDRAHVVLPHHVIQDILQENARGDQKIGTTLSGNGPVYSEKAARTGIRMGDLLNLNPEALLEVLNRAVAVDPLEIASYQSAVAFLRPYVADTVKLLLEADARGESILLAGAHGVMLDIDHGDYPMVSSSNATLGGAVTGSGLPLRNETHVIGCVKAFSTRVGGGVMPGEMNVDLGDRLREVGSEYGTTTGRPRRLSWLNVQSLAHQCKLSGVDELALMKVDTLDGVDEILVVERVLGNGEASLMSFPGWPAPFVTGSAVLHPNLERYIEYIEQATGVPVGYVSYGQDREMMYLR